jgi:Ran GTPase-activating protein (RanGAP) involved in mRNA processing and transport
MTAPAAASSYYSQLERLRSNDPTLTKLKLVQPPEVYAPTLEVLLEALEQNTAVTYVLFERNFVRGLSLEEWSSVLQAVGRMTNLEEIEIWSVRVPLEELCVALQRASKLRRLGFGFVTLLGSLNCDALRYHPSLRNFYLSDFRLSQESYTNDAEDGNNHKTSLNSLFEALSTCPKLDYVELFQYQQEEPPFTPRGLRQLLHSSSMQHLTMRRMGMTAELCSELALELANNQQLKILNLNENDIGDTGCIALGRALLVGNHSDLHEMNLRKNKITALGCLELAQLLTQNDGLEKLNLACNNLDDIGAQGLAVLLGVHPTLKTLELHRTNLTDVGCRTLAEVLRHNACLTTLDMSFNDITEDAYIHVADALKFNHTLKSINIQVNKKMKIQACEALLAMVKENFVLESISTLMRVRFEPKEYHQFEDLLHQINTYLRLNHVGRNRLLHGDATLQEWGSSLVALRDDLNGLFYLMKANPAMICHHLLLSVTSTNTTSSLGGGDAVVAPTVVAAE